MNLCSAFCGCGDENTSIDSCAFPADGRAHVPAPTRFGILYWLLGGRWNVLEHTNTDFRRGGFVTHTSPKLDNAMPRRQGVVWNFLTWQPELSSTQWPNCFQIPNHTYPGTFPPHWFEFFRMLAVGILLSVDVLRLSQFIPENGWPFTLEFITTVSQVFEHLFCQHLGHGHLPRVAGRTDGLTHTAVSSLGERKQS